MSYISIKKRKKLGLPWRSSGWDSALPLQGAWVRPLVRELRSSMPCGVAKKKKKLNMPCKTDVRGSKFYLANSQILKKIGKEYMLIRNHTSSLLPVVCKYKERLHIKEICFFPLVANTGPGIKIFLK